MSVTNRQSQDSVAQDPKFKNSNFQVLSYSVNPGILFFGIQSRDYLVAVSPGLNLRMLILGKFPSEFGISQIFSIIQKITQFLSIIPNYTFRHLINVDILCAILTKNISKKKTLVIVLIFFTNS
jgi:hypothetical protein